MQLMALSRCEMRSTGWQNCVELRVCALSDRRLRDEHRRPLATLGQLLRGLEVSDEL